jgi:uncharacterized protein YqjF (DUF2071 family)
VGFVADAKLSTYIFRQRWTSILTAHWGTNP